MSYDPPYKGNPASHYLGFVCSGDAWKPCPICQKGYRQWHDDGEHHFNPFKREIYQIEYSGDGRVLGSEYAERMTVK